MNCYIVKDLLPNYIDGLNRNETNAEISKHLEECTDCLAVYNKMSAAIPLEAPPKDISFLKKLKHRMFRINATVAVITCIVVLAGLIIFLMNHQIPIPFDPNRISVELIPVAVAYNDDGTVSWWSMDVFYNDNVYFFDEAERPTAYEYVRDSLHIVWQGFSNISFNGVGRDIIRDGEHVRVVYFRLSKTPWESLFFDYDLTDWQGAGSSTGTRIYGDRFQTVNQEPQMIEIFYLPVRNIIRLLNLSDADFDAQRLNGTLLWSGIN